jgi:stage V sporulation protein G
MKITEVRVSLRDEVKLKAFVTVVFDDVLCVRGVKVIRGRDGFLVAMPNRRKRDGTFQDIVHPTGSAMRDYLEEVVLGEYRRLVDGPDGAGVFAKLIPPTPTLFGAARVQRGIDGSLGIA